MSALSPAEWWNPILSKKTLQENITEVIPWQLPSPGLRGIAAFTLAFLEHRPPGKDASLLEKTLGQQPASPPSGTI